MPISFVIVIQVNFSHGKVKLVGVHGEFGVTEFEIADGK